MPPRAAPHTWPYEGHRTMAEVLADEERARIKARERYARDYISWRRAG